MKRIAVVGAGSEKQAIEKTKKIVEGYNVQKVERCGLNRYFVFGVLKPKRTSKNKEKYYGKAKKTK